MQISGFASGPHPAHPDSFVRYNLNDLWFTIRQNGGPSAKIGDLRTSGEVIARPWKVREQNNVYSIFGRPAMRYIDGRRKEPAPQQSLFLVQVDQGMTMLICGWIQLPGQFADDVEAFLDVYGKEPMHAA